ncbi:MAG: hypothetical protein RL701_7803 [Pseudomonadota bacterium]
MRCHFCDDGLHGALGLDAVDISRHRFPLPSTKYPSGTRQHDVIVMDINLPGMNGLEALRELRKSSATAELPVIAVSAAASERDKQRGLQAGFFAYLTKPVNVDEFVTVVRGLLTTPSVHG